MTDVNYDQAPAPVREDLSEAHRRAWRRLAEPGTWLSGAERVAIMAEVRNAAVCALCRRRKEALSPHAVEGAHERLGGLDDGLVEAVHRVRTDPARLTRSWFEGVIAGGVTVERYVEAIGVLGQTMAIDTFAHALGAAPWPPPEPVAGEATRYRPDGVSAGEAWVPMIAPRDATGAEADLFPKDRPVANIRRAMSLVPAEVRGFFDLTEVQYLPGPAMRDFATEYRAISHAQIELVAGRVSSLNGCVYWTTSHSLLLRASGRQDGGDYDLNAVMGDGHGGVAQGRLLTRFAEAALGNDGAALRAARVELRASIGDAALVDTCAVVGLFDAIDRVADATGIPLEEDKAADTADFRAALGIDSFASVAGRQM